MTKGKTYCGIGLYSNFADRLGYAEDFGGGLVV